MTLKTKIALILSFALMGVCFMGIANAQTARIVTLSWDLPTTAVDGTALTGQNALTKMSVYLNTVPIQDNSSMQATVDLPAGTVSSIQNFTVPVGGTLYARVKACNAKGCSDFSGQVTKVFPAPPPSAPGVPTNLVITVTVSAVDPTHPQVVARLVEAP